VQRKSEAGDINSRDVVSLVNGAISAKLAIANRAIAYGDGLFETIALIDGSPQHWTRHYRRLNAGCERLGIECPPDSILQRDLAKAQKYSPVTTRAVLKIIVTRGEGDRGYAPDPSGKPTRIVQISPWRIPIVAPTIPPLTLTTCLTRLGLNPSLAGIKHLNRLEQVLAAREVLGARADEGVMFDLADHAIAGTRSNLFVVSDGVIRTPNLEAAGVAGIMREIVFEEASSVGAGVLEGSIARGDLDLAEEIILTNSLRGVQPVTRFVTQEGRSRALSTTLGELLRRLFSTRGLQP
jgi:4-amino-4-deoxychorismate lyase